MDSQQEQEPQQQPVDENALNDLSNATTESPNIEQILEESRTKTRLQHLLGYVNIYLLLFLVLVVVAIIISIMLYLRSQREPDESQAGLKNLTQQELSEIATGDATVGDPKYVLNIQSDAVFAGNALIRGDLSVAGAMQLGQGLSVSELTVTGTANLATIQANALTVSGNTAVQGRLTANGGLNVSGSSNFGAPITATQITTGSLTLAGNGSLTINNHLNASGPTPGRSNGNALGSGGSSSISGSDLAGTININTGTGPSPGCFANISFVQSYNGTPQVIVTPVGAAAGSLQYYTNRSSGGFSICTANAAPGNTSFAFDYFVIN